MSRPSERKVNKFVSSLKEYSIEELRSLKAKFKSKDADWKYFECCLLIYNKTRNAADGLDLADCYKDGYGCQSNKNAALSHYKYLAGTETEEAVIAQHQIGMIYCSNQNVDEGARYFYMSASNGGAAAIEELKKSKSHLAPIYLGNLYFFDNKHAEKDILKALEYYGKVNSNDYPLVKDILIKVEEYIEKEKSGDEYDDLMLSLAMIYIKNFKEQFKEGTEKLSEYAEIIYKKGSSYEKTDINKAIEYYELAAEADNVSAQSRLGEIYYYGSGGVEKDFDKSLYYAVKAADKGDRYGMFRAGYIYQVIKKDYEKAFKYNTLAIENGSNYAKTNLGVQYACGRGVEQDIDKAAKLYYEAALHGDNVAFNNLKKSESHLAPIYLGDLYLDGKCVERNIQTALEYFGKVNSNDYPLVKDSLKKVEDYIKAEKPGDEYDDLMLSLALIYVKNFKEQLKEENPEKLSNYAGLLFEKGLSHKKTDINKAIDYIKLSAEVGYIPAQYELGAIYYYDFGLEEEGNFDKKAEKWLLMAAESSNDKYKNEIKKAQTSLADLYFSGGEVEVDIDKALHYALMAADSNSFAMRLAGLIYKEKKDYVKAFEYYTRAIENGMYAASVELGYLYDNGQGVEKDIDKATELYYEAASHNISWAVGVLKSSESHSAPIYLGDLYFEGKGVERNIQTALEYYGKVESNDYPLVKDSLIKVEEYIKKEKSGDEYSDLMLSLALIYIKNFREQLKEEDTEKLSNYAGLIFEKGLSHKKTDINKAIDYIKLSAEAGYIPAQYELGKIYDFGLKKGNYKEAEKWYLLAAESSNDKYKNEIKGAQACLADLYYFGHREVEKNIDKALHYASMAADSNSYAMRIVGWVQKNHKKNYEKAFEYYTRAIKAGSYVANADLGRLYYNGLGVEKDIDKATELYYEAASHNISWAVGDLKRSESHLAPIYLGDLYFEGKGVERNIQTALEYYCKADINDYTNLVKERLDNIIEGLKNTEAGSDHDDLTLILALIHMIRIKNSKEQLAEENAEKSNEDAEIIYRKGLSYEKSDKDKAIVYYELAAEANYIPAQYALGKIYDFDSDKKKLTEAEKWYLKVAESSNDKYKTEIEESLVALGNIYVRGEDGIERDLDKSYSYASRVLESNPRAIHIVGSVFHIKKNYKEAIKHFTIAAEKGFKRSVFNVGLYYELGLDVQKDIDKAIEIYCGLLNDNADEQVVSSSVLRLQKYPDNERAVCALFDHYYQSYNDKKTEEAYKNAVEYGFKASTFDITYIAKLLDILKLEDLDKENTQNLDLLYRYAKECKKPDEQIRLGSYFAKTGAIEWVQELCELAEGSSTNAQTYKLNAAIARFYFDQDDFGAAYNYSNKAENNYISLKKQPKMPYSEFYVSAMNDADFSEIYEIESTSKMKWLEKGIQVIKETVARHYSKNIKEIPNFFNEYIAKLEVPSIASKDDLYDQALQCETRNEQIAAIVFYYLAAKKGSRKALYTIINMSNEGSTYFLKRDSIKKYIKED